MLIEGSTDNVEEDPRHFSSMLMDMVKHGQSESKNITNAYDSITSSENNKLPPAIMDVIIKAKAPQLTDPKAAIRDLGNFNKYIFQHVNLNLFVLGIQLYSVFCLSSHRKTNCLHLFNTLAIFSMCIKITFYNLNSFILIQFKFYNFINNSLNVSIKTPYNVPTIIILIFGFICNFTLLLLLSGH